MLTRVEAAAARRRLRRVQRARPPAERRAVPAVERPAVPPAAPGTDGLPQIKHIVILMQENHSYDNYLGMLAGRGDGFTLDADGRPTETNPAGDGSVVPLWHIGKTSQAADVPTQTWHASHIQRGDGACDGFVRSIEETVPGRDARTAMRYWTEAELPFYYGLARTFPLAIRWFSACLGPTFPNRRFLIAGTANGLIDDLPFGMIDYPAAGTIFDHLSAHRITWANYHQLARARIRWRLLSHATGLRYLRLLAGAIGAAIPQLEATVTSKLQVTADLYPLGFLRTVNHVRPIGDFWADAAAGTLPSVSIVDPDFTLNSEENPQDIAAGEEFAARVINAVLAGKGWPQTLLVWLYDEHGGYYDHVPPPAAVPPDDVPASSPYERFTVLRLLRRTRLGKKITMADAGPRTYDRLGFRVPAVIVSPFARPGYVAEHDYDHTAILRLIERKWNLPPLTARDAAAKDLLDALDLTGPPAFLTPPILPSPRRKA
ncbi:MAG TPA: alkaline phosphatase family protein [Streptosporangiaceae bacterium]|jgi:phospholipase C